MRLGQVKMIDETTRPINGMMPNAQAVLIPQAASNPVMTLKTIATQNLTLPTLTSTAIKTVRKLKTIRPKKIRLTISARDSITTKCDS